MLQLPVSIRIPQANEMAHRPDIDALLNKRSSANIVQGFTITPNNTPQLPFKYYAAINVHNNKLWELFSALTGMLPDEVSCVYGLHDDEPITTGYFAKDYVLKVLQQYRIELSQDGTLEFGLLFHTKDTLVELFVTASKYIKFWGMDMDAFVKIMLDQEIPSKEQLEFVDEYPKIVEPLRDFIPSAKHPESVIHQLNIAFEVVKTHD
ncbi:hypothetical protein [Deminuibacter soli]|uniref:Uncharacterized protein n=1 Tax=Deminuibacter soli TaxID=2291815 RepID=A0A3E1NQ91_9BACT|nr:hypothetical protein [Deminuibacter soli]RFM30119.1 hypothetical protein DXN05_03860 [Deminuibacter soli]